MPGIKAAIVGLKGHSLTKDEMTLFREHDPWGFILFARNCEDPAQVKSLTDDLRNLTGRPDLPILIDQEGGRVQRLGPPHWPKYPPAQVFAKQYETEGAEAAKEAVFENSKKISTDLTAVGINVDCLPVLDVPVPGAHDIIGDRAYGATPDQIADLGRPAAEGLLAGQVLPVIKHMPGHGRALADSHHELPRIDTSLEVLEKTDFAPFRALNDMPLAMTAHVVLDAVDPDRPATCSPTVMDRIIRGQIGYQGLVMTDDLSMKALSGSFRDRAESSIAAGCDMLLHCNGDMAEMSEVLAASPVLDGVHGDRAEAALLRIS